MWARKTEARKESLVIDRTEAGPGGADRRRQHFAWSMRTKNDTIDDARKNERYSVRVPRGKEQAKAEASAGVPTRDCFCHLGQGRARSYE